jgi:hypothetical protein
MSLDQSNDFSFVAGVFYESYVRLGLMADFDVSNRIFASMFLPQNAQIFVILRSLLCCSSHHVTDTHTHICEAAVHADVIAIHEHGHCI